VLLDVEYIRDSFLPALRARYFDPDDGFDYHLRVSTFTDTLLYSSEGNWVGSGQPDASVRFFGIRLGGENRDLAEDIVPASQFAERSPSTSGDAPAGRGGRFMPPPGGAPRDLPGGWRLDLWNRAGSLPQVVTAARQRNLLIGFGILGLLGTSVILLLTAARRAERLARQQVEFVAGVTHELRTPITVILSAAENLADGLVSNGAEMKAYGALIRDDARHLRDMVEQILELAGADTRRRMARLEPVDLQPIVADAIKSCTSAFDRSGVDIRSDIPEQLPQVMGDPAALARVVRNLIDNAVKYAGTSCWVRVRAEVRDAGTRREVVLTVEDRGLGIEAEDLPHVFEPFYRAQTVVGLRIPGTGLGLSVVLRIVEDHGGRITVESAPNRGSSFTVTLPAAVIASASAAAGMDGPTYRLH
jgi:signal transduction histidine kinase